MGFFIHAAVRSCSLSVSAIVVAFAGALAAGEVTTWRGPRADGVFPARDLVTSADEAAGKNIVWKAPLPFMGCNSPVYAGGRVFVLCDAGWKSDAPLLLAFDVKDGRERWRATVDNLDARPKAEADWARRERAKEYAMARRGRELQYAFDRAADDSEREKIKTTAAAEGFAFKGKKGKGRFSISSSKRIQTPAHTQGQDYKRLAGEGLFWWEGWYYPYSTFQGQTYPSPVSDGVHVWVWTNNCAAACFTLDGKRKWIVDVRMPGGGHGGGPITTASPTVVGEIIVLFKYDCCVALEKATGKELWRHEPQFKGGYQAGSAAVSFALEGTEYLYLTSSEILRLADGKVVGRLHHPADLAGKKRSHGPYFGGHGQSIARGDMIWVLHNGYGGGAKKALGGIYAYRLKRKGDEVAGELVWQSEGGVRTIALDGERLYKFVEPKRGGTTIYNAADGSVLAKRKLAFKGHDPIVTDDLVVTLTSSKTKYARGSDYRGNGKLLFYDKRTLKQLGEAILLMDVRSPEVDAKRIARVAKPIWNWGDSSPTAWGNRVFVRSFDALYCIGDPGVLFAE